MATRALLEVGLCRPSEMSKVSVPAFKSALTNFEAAQQRLAKSGADQDDVAKIGDDVLESAKKYQRKLSAPGWSTGDRANLNDRLAGWMVDGSPYELLHEVEQLVGRMHRSRLMAGVVEIMPVMPYEPQR